MRVFFQIFGFLSWILFTVDFFLHMRQYGQFPCSKRKRCRVTVQQVLPVTVNEQEQEQEQVAHAILN